MTTATALTVLLVWAGAGVGFIVGYQLAHAQVTADILAILNEIKEQES